jgi:TPP-dependent pyruvate/acetoin dehydrogenase alpha subunit
MNHSPKTLMRLLTTMLKIRMVEEKIADLYHQQEMRCPVHLCIGQEAICAGVCCALNQSDAIYSNHRSHGHYLAKGGDMVAMIAEIYGKADGCCGGKGGSMHLIDKRCGFGGAVPIVGSTLPIAVGHALANRIRREDALCVVFFGDGTVEEGVFHESLNYAALKKLRVLFICENNYFSVYSPLEVRQPPSRTISDIVAGHGIHWDRGDGNDVLAVHEKTLQAIDYMNRLGRPAFLEFETYRWREHCGPNYDNNLGYRAECDFAQWISRCPLKRYISYLQSRGLLSDESLADIQDGLENDIDRAFAAARRSPWPDAKTALGPVYA